MPYKIKPEDRIHIGDFRERPFAKHAPDLQRLLNTLRAGPMAGRYVLVCTKPFKEWRLARHPGEVGKPVEILDHPPFASRAEGEWAVFKLRWKEHTGEDLN
jgi:hypothetical protein